MSFQGLRETIQTHLTRCEYELARAEEDLQKSRSVGMIDLVQKIMRLQDSIARFKEQLLKLEEK